MIQNDTIYIFNQFLGLKFLWEGVSILVPHPVFIAQPDIFEWVYFSI